MVFIILMKVSISETRLISCLACLVINGFFYINTKTAMIYYDTDVYMYVHKEVNLTQPFQTFLFITHYYATSL